MKKSEIDLLHQSEPIDTNNQILALTPKTPQQHFLLTYLGIRILDSNPDAALQQVLLAPLTGSFSQLLLVIKYMRKSMDKGKLLDNSNYHILSTLILWMAEQEKGQKNPKSSILHTIFLPHPSQLAFQQFEELIVYLNYIALDIIKILKYGEADADDLLQLLEIILPRVYYNIILTLDSLGEESDQTQDVLFYNQSLQYFTRTNSNYRALCKVVLKQLLNMPLKQNQMRELLERSCRYYLLFWKQHKQSTDIFLAAFQKATEAARFSLTDEFVLFFRVIAKLGDVHLQKLIRSKNGWIHDLLNKFGSGSIIGHPKGQVNPFNLLSIKQAVKVEAGKADHRIIQIYNEYSLFYFKVDIQSHDISVRLFYLGDFESKVEVKKLLLTQEKVSTELRSAFVAAKKGIYMIEFDNGYSWLNNKSLKFQYILLAQYKQYDYPIWMKNIFSIKTEQNEKKEKKEDNDIRIDQPEKERDEVIQRANNKQQNKHIEYYQQEHGEDVQQEQEEESLQQSKIAQKSQNVQQHDKQPDNQQQNNHIPIWAQNEYSVQKNQQPINKVQKQIPSKPQQLKNETFTQVISSNSLPSQQQNDKSHYGQANLSLIDSIFSLLVNIHDHTYEFQTNLQDRIHKRLKAYCEGQDRLQWIFNSEARDWLKRHGFAIVAKSGASLLLTAEQLKSK